MTEGKSKREIMRCLKRYAAREIYRQITNSRPAPDISDLRRMRTELGMTITTVARELGQWVSIISRLERGHIRNDELAESYRQWLTGQHKEGGMEPVFTPVTGIDLESVDQAATVVHDASLKDIV